VNNRAITFNYDLLFDRHLLNNFGPQETYFEDINGEEAARTGA